MTCMHSQTRIPSAGSRLPQLVFSDAALSAAKWLALLLMVVDHANKYLLAGSQSWMYALGRLSMPLFAFVLAYNLARPGVLVAGGYRRVAIRLLVFGLLAIAPFVVLNKLTGGWWPLNMLFTLLVATVCAWCFDKGTRLAVVLGCLVFVWGGALGEYWWPAVGFFLGVWSYCRRPSLSLIPLSILCLCLLYFVNGNFWALAVVPLLAILRMWTFELPRMRWFFYVFYPLHLVLFWAYLAAVGGVLQGLV